MSSSEKKTVPIHFWNPSKRLDQYERRSKLLDPQSALCHAVHEKRLALIAKYGNLIAEKRMEFHIELLQCNESSPKLLVQRAQELEGQEIPFPLQLIQYGKAVVVQTPAVDGYGKTHCTICYFSQGIPKDLKI